MKVKEEYVFEYFRKDSGRETIVWGPEKAVRQLMKLDSIEFGDIPLGVIVVKREYGKFNKDYKEVFYDVEEDMFFYRKLLDCLRRYYIPASRDEMYWGFENHDGYVFLETLKENSNVIYSYIGYKIEYYIKNTIEIPMNILESFLYDDSLYDIYNNIYKTVYNEKIYEKYDLQEDIITLERVTHELDEIIDIISNLSFNIANIKKELI